MSETILEYVVPQWEEPAEEIHDYFCLQRWSLPTWENAEEELNEANLFAYGEPSKIECGAFDDKDNSLRKKGCWVYEVVEQHKDGIENSFVVKIAFQRKDGCVEWTKETFSSLIDVTKFLQQRSYHYDPKTLGCSLRFCFQRQDLFYLGTECVEAYVDSVELDGKYYNVGTFKRRQAPFQLLGHKFLIPARSKTSQMLFVKEPNGLYKDLLKLEIVKDLSYKGHLSSKPFTPKKAFPANFGEQLFNQLKTFLNFPESTMKKLQKEAESDKTPLVILLKEFAAHIDPLAFEAGKRLQPILLGQ